jgi:hypothetical protein
MPFEGITPIFREGTAPRFPAERDLPLNRFAIYRLRGDRGFSPWGWRGVTMFSSIERWTVGSILAAGIVAGIVGYAGIGSASAPAKVWFDAAGGDVIFDHEFHTGVAACPACHHDLEPEGRGAGSSPARPRCRSCHYAGSIVYDTPPPDPHPRAIGARCLECHEGLAESLAKCGACHVLRPGFAFEATSREKRPLPEAVEFATDGGKVVFGHRAHVEGGLACSDCHHPIEGEAAMEGMEREKRCRVCHHELSARIAPYEGESHAGYLTESCATCHDEEDCGTCHAQEERQE